MNHFQLIELGQALGYKNITRGGTCHGFSMMWIQAACSNELDAFNKRMVLLNEFNENPTHLLTEIKRVRALVKEKQVLIEKDKELLEIPAFFEGISLYQSPHTHSETFNDNLIQTDESNISEYTQSQNAEGGLHSIKTSGQYSKQKLDVHLNNLANELELKGSPNVAISFRSSNHTVSARYIGNGEFEFIDTNSDTNSDTKQATTITTKRLNTEQLGNALRESFKTTVKDETLIMSTTLFGSNPEQIHHNELTNSPNKIDHLQADAQGVTLLHQALIENDQALFNRIDLTEVDVNQLTNQGRCALSFCCAESSSKKIFDRLLAVDNINVNPPNSDWCLPISEAILAARWDMASEMIEHPTFNPDAKNIHSLNYLHTVAGEQSPDALDIAIQLINKGVDINAQSYDGITPLHQACTNGNTDMLELLLENGANINAQSYNGITPLHQACAKGNADMLELLLENGANINAKNSSGHTVLHYALNSPNNIALLLQCQFRAKNKTLN